MANPQTENGYTPIANEILEALARFNLSAYESRVLWYIIRKTYGWHRKHDLISLSQIVVGTGIKKGHVSRTVKSLISHSIVTRLGNKQIGFQKDYEQWSKNQIQKLPNEVTNNKTDTKVTYPGQKVTSLGNKKLPVEEPQKIIKKLTKEIVITSKDTQPDPRVKEVMLALEERRGFVSPRHAAECKAVKNMLRRHSSEEIMACYESERGRAFWQDKALYMMNVDGQIDFWKQRQRTQEEYSPYD